MRQPDDPAFRIDSSLIAFRKGRIHWETGNTHKAHETYALGMQNIKEVEARYTPNIDWLIDICYEFCYLEISLGNTVKAFEILPDWVRLLASWMGKEGYDSKIKTLVQICAAIFNEFIKVRDIDNATTVIDLIQQLDTKDALSEVIEMKAMLRHYSGNIPEAVSLYQQVELIY